MYAYRLPTVVYYGIIINGRRHVAKSKKQTGLFIIGGTIAALTLGCLVCGVVGYMNTEGYRRSAAKSKHGEAALKHVEQLKAIGKRVAANEPFNLSNRLVLPTKLKLATTTTSHRNSLPYMNCNAVCIDLDSLDLLVKETTEYEVVKENKGDCLTDIANGEHHSHTRRNLSYDVVEVYREQKEAYTPNARYFEVALHAMANVEYAVLLKPRSYNCPIATTYSNDFTPGRMKAHAMVFHLESGKYLGATMFEAVQGNRIDFKYVKMDNGFNTEKFAGQEAVYDDFVRIGRKALQDSLNAVVTGAVE